MLRLPSQFEPDQSHTKESAAGGAGCSTCSCCVVTMGAATLLTSAYFANLPRDPKAASGAPVASGGNRVPDGTETSTDLVFGAANESSIPGPAATDPAGKALPPASSRAWSGTQLAILGFFSALVAIGTLFLSLEAEWLLILAPVIWFSSFVAAHKFAGRSIAGGILAGVIALVVFVLIAFAEMWVWLS